MGKRSKKIFNDNNKTIITRKKKSAEALISFALDNNKGTFLSVLYLYLNSFSMLCN